MVVNDGKISNNDSMMNMFFRTGMPSDLKWPTQLANSMDHALRRVWWLVKDWWRSHQMNALKLQGHQISWRIFCLGSRGYNRIHVLKTILNHPWLAMVYVYIYMYIYIYTTYKNADDRGMVQMALFYPHYSWLVLSTPLKKYEFVSWDGYSQLNGKS